MRILLFKAIQSRLPVGGSREPRARGGWLLADARFCAPHRVSDSPKLALLREGLKLFIGHFLRRGAPASMSEEAAERLRARADLSTKALQGKASLMM